MKILGFGMAPKATAMGYGVFRELFIGTNEEAEKKYAHEDVVLVNGATIFERPGACEYGVFSKTYREYC